MAAPIVDGLTRAQRYYRRHRAKLLLKAKAAYDANPDYFRAKQKRSKARRAAWQRAYVGLPEATRPEPLACESCGSESGHRWRNAGLCLDHDHVTKKFRGWLCTMCNIGIGNLGDNAEGVVKALDYLKRAE